MWILSCDTTCANNYCFSKWYVFHVNGFCGRPQHSAKLMLDVNYFVVGICPKTDHLILCTLLRSESIAFGRLSSQLEKNYSYEWSLNLTVARVMELYHVFSILNLVDLLVKQISVWSRYLMIDYLIFDFGFPKIN